MQIGQRWEQCRVGKLKGQKTVCEKCDEVRNARVFMVYLGEARCLERTTVSVAEVEIFLLVLRWYASDLAIVD